jgi:Tol biopolymer transport system component
MRLPDIGAARLELQEVLAGGATDAETPRREIEEAGRMARRGRARERAVFLAVALALAGLSSFLVWQRVSQVPEPRPPAHFTLDTPEDLAFWLWSPVAVSPDGRYVAFVATPAKGSRQLWLRPLDSTEARPLPGTEEAWGGHFWSPDGLSIAFASAGGELRKVGVASGTVQRLCKLPQEFDAGTWSPEGTIVFAAGGPNGRLYSVPAAGGEPRLLASPDEARKETSLGWPQFLPDGRHLLLSVGATDEGQAGLYIASLAAPAEKRRIRSGPARAQLVPGQLLFVQDGTLMAQRFDARALVTMGEAVPLASSVTAFSSVSGFGWFSASATGRVAWLSGQNTTDSRLEWVDREGRSKGSLAEPGKYSQLALSPDGRRVAVEIADGDGRYDIWLIDVARGVPSRLTTDPGDEREPVWSPDGQELLFTSDAGGDQNILRKRLQSADPAAPLRDGVGHTPAVRDIPEAWLREKNTLIFLTIGGAERGLWTAPLDGGGAPEALLKGFAIDEPHVSADGRWLAYVSDQSGRPEVYVEPFRRPGEKLRVSASGGGQPRWRGDGKELFFLSPDGALMAATVRTAATALEVGIPTTLVPSKTLQAVVQGPDYDDYDVTADGQRFLIKRVEGSERPRIHVLLDWPSLLQR